MEEWQVAVRQIVAGDTADPVESATLNFKRQGRFRDNAVGGSPRPPPASPTPTLLSSSWVSETARRP